MGLDNLIWIISAFACLKFCIIFDSLPTYLKYEVNKTANGKTCLLSTFD
jgi:hypothetical protein